MTIRRRAALALLVGAALLLGAGRLPGGARAEELPITVPLTYIVNLSNWGPTTAGGTASVWRTEAEVRLSVRGLPVLQGQLYALWLVNPQAGQFLAISRFNVAADGTALLDISLPGSLPDTYTLALITVQPDPEANHSVPSHLFSIAGYFPGNSATESQIHHLPDTGSAAANQAGTLRPASADGWRTALAWALLGVAAVALLAVWRRGARFQRR